MIEEKSCLNGQFLHPLSIIHFCFSRVLKWTRRLTLPPLFDFWWLITRNIPKCIAEETELLLNENSKCPEHSHANFESRSVTLLNLKWPIFPWQRLANKNVARMYTCHFWYTENGYIKRKSHSRQNIMSFKTSFVFFKGCHQQNSPVFQQTVCKLSCSNRRESLDKFKSRSLLNSWEALFYYSAKAV